MKKSTYCVRVEYPRTSKDQPGSQPYELFGPMSRRSAEKLFIHLTKIHGRSGVSLVPTRKGDA